MASYLHHTATTKYPCCVPALGDSEGASCVELAVANLQSIFMMTSKNFPNFYVTNPTHDVLMGSFPLQKRKKHCK